MVISTMDDISMTSHKNQRQQNFLLHKQIKKMQTKAQNVVEKRRSQSS